MASHVCQYPIHDVQRHRGLPRCPLIASWCDPDSGHVFCSYHKPPNAVTIQEFLHPPGRESEGADDEQ
jgi:hypothetical protein